MVNSDVRWAKDVAGCLLQRLADLSLSRPWNHYLTLSRNSVCVKLIDEHSRRFTIWKQKSVSPTDYCLLNLQRPQVDLSTDLDRSNVLVKLVTDTKGYAQRQSVKGRFRNPCFER